MVGGSLSWLQASDVHLCFGKFVVPHYIHVWIFEEVMAQIINSLF
jgi:hypothetical protein